jgi:hypothetical protein
MPSRRAEAAGLEAAQGLQVYGQPGVCQPSLDSATAT